MRTQNPIIGRSKGQAGGMVFTTLFGQNIAKAKPYSYRDANTNIQQSNRTLMSLVVRLAASLKLFARGLFHIQPAGMSAYSRLIQQFQNAVTGTGINRKFDPIGTEIGSGNFAIDITSAEYDTVTGAFVVTYLQTDVVNVDDLAIVPSAIVINANDCSLIQTNSFAGALSTGQLTFDAPEGLTVQDLAVVVVYSNTKSGSELAKGVKIWSAVTAS